MSVDLTTSYLGLRLKNPIVVGASPLSSKMDMLKRMEAAGAAAAVMPSLFEEQIEHEEWQISRLYDFQAESCGESLSYFTEMRNYNVGPDHYLLNLQEAKRTVGIPIIGSLNGASDGGWTRYAHHIQESGADALELNIYFVPTDPDMDPKEIENKYVDLVASVRAKISIPLAIKIGPFFTNAGHIAKRLVEAGANGLVVFNRYLEPDIDIDALRIEPKLVLSNRHELWLALRWIAILRSSCTASLAATSGIHVAKDVAKALLAGADVAMIASVLMTHGVEHIAKLLTELRTWMEEKEYQSVKQLRGSMSRDKCPDPSALERINYTKALVSYVPDVL